MSEDMIAATAMIWGAFLCAGMQWFMGLDRWQAAIAVAIGASLYYGGRGLLT